MRVTERQIKMLTQEDGRCPFQEWFDGIEDIKTSAVIDARLARVESGSLGVHENVGEGVWELKIDFGPGYRVYYAEYDQTIVVLLGGGTKKKQRRDIDQAKSLWEKYRYALKDYNETYAHRMRDKDYLNAYLAACLAEGPEAFYVGLRRAVQARENGFTWLATQTGMGRESLYRALSADGNPSFRTILKVLRALGADDDILSQSRANAEAAPQELAARA